MEDLDRVNKDPVQVSHHCVGPAASGRKDGEGARPGARAGPFELVAKLLGPLLG